MKLAPCSGLRLCIRKMAVSTAILPRIYSKTAFTLKLAVYTRKYFLLKSTANVTSVFRPKIFAGPKFTTGRGVLNLSNNARQTVYTN